MIKLTWKVKRESGRPLLPADIERYELVVTRDGVIVTIPNPPADVTDYSFDADPGVWAVGLTCVPKRGGKSDPATGTITLFDETKVVIFDFTIEVVAP